MKLFAVTFIIFVLNLAFSEKILSEVLYDGLGLPVEYSGYYDLLYEGAEQVDKSPKCDTVFGGSNHKFKSTSENPVFVYFCDFDITIEELQIGRFI